jgi:DNA polymerase family B
VTHKPPHRLAATKMKLCCNRQQVAERVRERQVPLAKFLVTKQLTKRPEDYPDARNQPHVQVALRRRAAGLRNGTMQARCHAARCVDGSVRWWTIMLAQEYQTPRQQAHFKSWKPALVLRIAVMLPKPNHSFSTLWIPCKHTCILTPASCSQGETVPYIICIDRSGGGGEVGEAGGAASGKGLAQRAYHIDEVRAPGAQLEVDAAYYLSQQARLSFRT